jgi:hypothetical protein
VSAANRIRQMEAPTSEKTGVENVGENPLGAETNQDYASLSAL